MKIKQLSNKKIQFWEGSSIVFSCMPNQNYKVINSNEIHLINAGVKALSLFASNINQTSILGAAFVDQDFKNSQELAEFLDTNFFFDVEKTSNVFGSLGINGNYNQGQVTGKSFANSTALAIGTIYVTPIWLDGLYTEFVIQKPAAGTGFVNFGIYDFVEGPGVAHAPGNLILQSAEFNPAAVATLMTETLSPAMYFRPGTYYFAITADTAFSFLGAIDSENFLGLFETAVPSLVKITRYTKAGAYASTLPSTFTGFLNDLANPIQPVLFFKRQL